MPELPEVETVVRDLRPVLVGRRFVAVRGPSHKLRRPWRPEWADALTGATVAAVGRRGKWIVVELGVRSDEPWGLPPRVSLPPVGASPTARQNPALPPAPRLVVHLGMTGQLTVAPTDTPFADHTHLLIDLDAGGQLRFRDARRFGSVELFPDAAAVTAFLADRLGPEPDAVDPAAFRAALQGTTRTLKAVLLDQTVVAGVGNIYADEALHRAGLHPERRAGTLTVAEADRLRAAVAEVIADAIEHRGSSIRDYVGGAGQRGRYQDRHKVYGRPGEPCPGCAAPIEVPRVAGRSSHYCPVCQRQGQGAGGKGRGKQRSRPAPS